MLCPTPCRWPPPNNTIHVRALRGITARTSKTSRVAKVRMWICRPELSTRNWCVRSSRCLLINRGTRGLGRPRVSQSPLAARGVWVLGAPRMGCGPPAEAALGHPRPRQPRREEWYRGASTRRESEGAGRYRLSRSRIGPRVCPARSAAGVISSSPCVMRSDPAPASSAATARICGMSARQWSGANARATSLGQIDASAARALSSCAITRAIASVVGGAAVICR